jgi:hypothetical protein
MNIKQPFKYFGSAILQNNSSLFALLGSLLQHNQFLVWLHERLRNGGCWMAVVVSFEICWRIERLLLCISHLQPDEIPLWS